MFEKEKTTKIEKKTVSSFYFYLCLTVYYVRIYICPNVFIHILCVYYFSSLLTVIIFLKVPIISQNETIYS